MKKTILITTIIIILLIVAGCAFCGGMLYQKSQVKGFVTEDRFPQMGQNGIGAGRNTGAGFVTGEIISKDDNSITLKNRDGGSKIVFFSESTEISKFTSGTKEDLITGQAVTITGKTNSDGSLTAEIIQIRPTINVKPGL